MATKRGEKRNIDDNERISRRNTEKSSEAEKRIRLSDDNVEGIYDMICIIFFIRNYIIYSKLYFIVKVNKKSIEKLLRTNSQIISKLEVLITGQKNLKTCHLGIEKKLNDDNKNNNTIDSEYIKVIKMNII